MKAAVYIVTIVCLALAACVKKTIPIDESKLGMDYYPTTEGKYVIYDVDSTVYTDIPRDTIHYRYRIKEKLADRFTDNEGQPAIRLERYIKMYDPKKSYDSIPWSVKEVWMVNANNRSVQVTERNIRYTKLIFPVQEKASWKGNARNNVGDWDYTYEYIDKTESMNGVKLDKVLLVSQFTFTPQIFYKKYSEKYAKGVGLVYREIYDVVSEKVVVNVPVLDRIEHGLIYKQTLLSYGYE